MNLIIDFAESSVTIELLDNPVVNKWLEKFKTVTKWRAWETGQTTTLPDNKGPYENKELRRKGLIAAIKNFELETGLTFPISVNVSTEFSRQDLNKIHRYFTTASGFNSWDLDSPKLIARDDPAYDVFNRTICDINSAVHILEGYYSTSSKVSCQDVKIVEFIAEDQPADYYDLIPGDWKYLDYNLEFDVFIRYAILGKDYFQGFIDEDDPRHWDITAQTALHENNFYIDVDSERNNIMKTHLFKMYVRNSSLYNGAWQFMPLGKVVSGTINLQNTKVKGIRLA
jgi:hypothetical protein